MPQPSKDEAAPRQDRWISSRRKNRRRSHKERAGDGAELAPFVAHHALASRNQDQTDIYHPAAVQYCSHFLLNLLLFFRRSGRVVWFSSFGSNVAVRARERACGVKFRGKDGATMDRERLTR